MAWAGEWREASLKWSDAQELEGLQLQHVCAREGEVMLCKITNKGFSPMNL